MPSNLSLHNHDEEIIEAMLKEMVIGTWKAFSLETTNAVEMQKKVIETIHEAAMAAMKQANDFSISEEEREKAKGCVEYCLKQEREVVQSFQRSRDLRFLVPAVGSFCILGLCIILHKSKK